MGQPATAAKRLGWERDNPPDDLIEAMAKAWYDIGPMAVPWELQRPARREPYRDGALAVLWAVFDWVVANQ